MEKLIALICELVEKMEKLITTNTGISNGIEVESDVFPVEISNEIPQKFTGNNPNRLEAWFHNDSESDLFLTPATSGSNVTRDRFSIRVAPGDTYIMNAQQAQYVFRRSVYGFWEVGAAADSRVMVTEFTAIRA